MIPIPSSLALKLIAGACAVLMLALLVHDRNRWKAKTEHYSELLSAERAANGATVANYRAAAERARRADAENLVRVRAEQEEINERTANDFESRIAVARARADELQRQAGSAAADPRGGGAAPLPGLSVSAEGVAQAAGEDRLPESERLIATEQAIQLDELIKWVRSQAKVNMTGETP
jgi:hypothetical protein